MLTVSRESSVADEALTQITGLDMIVFLTERVCVRVFVRTQVQPMESSASPTAAGSKVSTTDATLVGPNERCLIKQNLIYTFKKYKALH